MFTGSRARESAKLLYRLALYTPVRRADVPGMNLRRRGELLDALDLIAADVRRGPFDPERLFGALVRWEREASAAGWTVPERSVDLRDGTTPAAVLVSLEGLRALLAGGAGAVH